ncbi:MAG TPA: hypothetical protein LFW20_05120 [Rickettsia endosymbiont of Omalisus fontisbellaquei]|nr:hypothetical protein [Rickettsia endosymbiont of Omalisus fontisbellaquei]
MDPVVKPRDDNKYIYRSMQQCLARMKPYSKVQSTLKDVSKTLNGSAAYHRISSS